MNERRKIKPITEWLKENKGVTLRYISTIAKKEYNIKCNVVQLYHFTKGTTRNAEIEDLFLKIGVPEKIINETFKKTNNDI